MTDTRDESIERVSIDKQFEFISGQVSLCVNATEDGLKLFIPMFAAILGGSIWLRFQTHTQTIPRPYIILSDALVLLLTGLCIYMTAYNFKAWWEYRNELSEITSSSAYHYPRPRWTSIFIEGGLCALMVTACALFIAFNPFVGRFFNLLRTP